MTATLLAGVEFLFSMVQVIDLRRGRFACIISSHQGKVLTEKEEEKGSMYTEPKALNNQGITNTYWFHCAVLVAS